MQDLKQEVEMTSHSLDVFTQKGIDDYLTEDTYSNVISQIQCLNQNRPLRILDLGCGIGNWSREFAKRNHEVTGIDLSPDVIKFAEDTTFKKNLKVTYLIGDIRNIDFSEEKFDLVFLGGVFHHLNWQEINVLLDTIKTLLVKGGTIAALEWNKYFLKTQMNYKLRDFLKRTYSPNEQPISPRKLRDSFLQKDFKEITMSVPECKCIPGVGDPMIENSTRFAQVVLNKITGGTDLIVQTILNQLNLQRKVPYGWQFLIIGKL